MKNAMRLLHVGHVPRTTVPWPQTFNDSGVTIFFVFSHTTHHPSITRSPCFLRPHRNSVPVLKLFYPLQYNERTPSSSHHLHPSRPAPRLALYWPNDAAPQSASLVPSASRTARQSSQQTLRCHARTRREKFHDRDVRKNHTHRARQRRRT